MNAWLAVDEQLREETRDTGTPEFVATQPAEIVSANVETRVDSTWPPSEVPSPIREILEQPPLQYTANCRTDRVERIAVRHEASEIAVVRYRLAGREGAVNIGAWDGEVHPADDAKAPFRTLRLRMWGAGLIGLLGSLALVGWFVNRHWYFETSPQAAILVLLAIILPILLVIPIAYAARPATKRRPGILLATCVPALMAMVGQGLSASASPSLERAEAFVSAGEPERARREALAAAELEIEPDRARRLHDELQQGMLAAIKEPARLLSRLEQAQFLTSEGRTQAENRAVEYTASFAEDLQGRGKYRESLTLIAGVPEPFRQATPIRLRALSAHAHEASGYWRTIKSSAPLPERLAACKSIQVSLQELLKGGRLPAEARDIERACLSVQAQEAGRGRREAESARRRQLKVEQQARDAERSYEAAMRAWQRAPLLCRDGTLSASCVCGGSRRGCCSRHGGVAGCSQSSPDPPVRR